MVGFFIKEIIEFLFFNLDDNEEQGKEKNKCVLLWQVKTKN